MINKNKKREEHWRRRGNLRNDKILEALFTSVQKMSKLKTTTVLNIEIGTTTRIHNVLSV